MDYSGWFFSYDRWNCSRFQYENNPYWGEVWVTNTRSKDGVGYLMGAAVPIYYASLTADAADVREACSEAFGLLELFVRDIVDHDYTIRTKDPQGQAYLPGTDTGPPEANTGDLASFAAWELLFPDAECNNKQAAALMAYHDVQDNQCDPFGGNPTYERLSIKNNPPNGHIMRSFHIANILFALLHGHSDIARTSLDGLEERFERDLDYDLTNVNVDEDCWRKDVAVNFLFAAAAGYPLTSEEVRIVQGYFSLAVDEFEQWTIWNLWDDAVADGEHAWRPPSSKTDEQGVKTCWPRPEAMGLLYLYCWSPFKNPAGARLVDCEGLMGTQGN